MNKFKRNIIRIFLPVFILFTGNFSYALAHIDCVGEDNIHVSCSNNCCERSENCSDSENGRDAEFNKNKTCCDIHESNIKEQDHSFRAINKSIEKIKLIFHHINEISGLPEIKFVSLIIHTLRSTNIYLSISSLRI